MGFFGDSTMEQTMYNLQGYLHATSCVDSILPKVNYDDPQMGVNNLLRKQLETFYSPSSSDRRNNSSNNKDKQIDILLMNLGTKYPNMTMFEEGMRFLQDDINYFQSLHDPKYHDISYLWRLNIVPHPHCEEYKYPFTDHFTESQKTVFLAWNEFHVSAREMMETLQIPILEVTEAFTMRPDAHIVINASKYDDDYVRKNGGGDHQALVGFDWLLSCQPGGGMDVQIQMIAHYLYYHNQLSHSHRLQLRSDKK